MRKGKYVIVVVLSIIAYIILNLNDNDDTVKMTPAFYEAVKVINVDSQKTLAILNAIAADTIEFNETERMYYRMYLLYARDKEGQGQIPISETARFVDYYSNNEIDSLKMMALYLHAGAYRDAKDMPSAIGEYMEAIEFGKEKKLYGDRFFERCFVQLAQCYNNVFLGDKALSVLKESLKYIKDSYVSRVYLSLSYVYANMHKIDSAKYCAEKSLQTCLQANRSRIAVENINLFIKDKDSLYVSRYKDSLLAVNEDDMTPRYAMDYAYSKALYYDFIQKPDSAAHYFKKTLSYNADLLICRNVAECLYLHCKKNGDYVETLKYADLCNQLSDSVIQNTESQRVAQVGNMFNYQLQQKENNEKLQNTNKSLKMTLWGVVSLFITIGALFVVLSKHKKKYNKNLEMSQKEINTIQQKCDMLGGELSDVQQEKNVLETENNILTEDLKNSLHLQRQRETEVASLNHELEHIMKEKLALAQKNAQLTLQLAEETKVEKALAEVERLKLRLRLQQQAISSDDWASLRAAVDVVYPQLHIKIDECLPSLKLDYVQLIYFSILSLTGTCMSNLLGSYAQAVTKMKKRLIDWTNKNNQQLKISNFEQLIAYLKS